MESVDSLSADLARDGSICEEAIVLAKDAVSYFQSGKLRECIEILIQLNKKKHNDPKVLHNMAIAKYLKDGCSNSKKLMEDLNNVLVKSEEAETVENVSKSKDKNDTTVAILNIAVTWFHLHQYQKSLSILEPLFQIIQHLNDETIAVKICFLMLDIALACRDAVRFCAVFEYMEKTFASEQEIIASSSLLSSSDLSLTEEEQPPLIIDLVKTGSDLKFELQLYKVRFLLVTKNFKQAKLEVKHAMNNIAEKREALHLKSQVEYANGNYSKAIKLLLAASSDIQKEEMTFNNNLGCIYYQLGKYQTCSVFFTKALRRKENHKSFLIVYNCGMLYLACEKPLLAAQCFQKASIVFCRKALIWLRIAECCIMALQKGLLDTSEIRVHVLGKGKWRQVIMDENNGSSTSSSTQRPKLSLRLARVCLSNGLYLLKEEVSSSSSDNGENLVMKQALLANMAYVELELENPIKALAAAKSLLEIPYCSKIYVFLGNIYAAEALCLINRPIEAASFLSAYLLGHDGGFKLPFGQQDFDQWRIHTSSDSQESSTLDSVFVKPEEACGALYANFAALLATQGHHDQARPLITQALTLLPNNVQATITAVYIDLMLGRKQEAIARLKQCTRVSFLPAK